MNVCKVKSVLKIMILGVLFGVILSNPAFAALEDSIEELQSRIETISIPLAIIFLIIAGWQKAMGNNYLFVAALIGTVIVFAAPQLVLFISTAFGG